MYVLDIDEIWRRLKKYEGEAFYTVTGLEFSYLFKSENTIEPSRTKYNLSKDSFIKTIDLLPISKVSEISKKIRGSSYIYAILMDKRFKGDC